MIWFHHFSRHSLLPERFWLSLSPKMLATFWTSCETETYRGFSPGISTRTSSSQRSSTAAANAPNSPTIIFDRGFSRVQMPHPVANVTIAARPVMLTTSVTAVHAATSHGDSPPSSSTA